MRGEVMGWLKDIGEWVQGLYEEGAEQAGELVDRIFGWGE